MKVFALFFVLLLAVSNVNGRKIVTHQQKGGVVPDIGTISKEGIQSGSTTGGHQEKVEVHRRPVHSNNNQEENESNIKKQMGHKKKKPTKITWQEQISSLNGRVITSQRKRMKTRKDKQRTKKNA